MRCAETTCASCGIPNSLRMATACCITSQSDEEPMTTPTIGAGAVLSLMSVFQRGAGQALQRFAVLGAGFFDDFRRQCRSRRRLLPAVDGFQIVAHELLVERWWRDPDLVAVGWPETRRVGGQHLIHQVQYALVVEAEFKFGVGDDDAACRRVIGGSLIQLDADV